MRHNCDAIVTLIKDHIDQLLQLCSGRVQLIVVARIYHAYVLVADHEKHDVWLLFEHDRIPLDMGSNLRNGCGYIPLDVIAALRLE